MIWLLKKINKIKWKGEGFMFKYRGDFLVFGQLLFGFMFWILQLQYFFVLEVDWMR